MYAVFTRRRQADAIPPKYPPHFVGTEEPVILYPQEAPDPIRRGNTPVRIARQRVNFYFNPTQFQSEGFPSETRRGGLTKVMFLHDTAAFPPQGSRGPGAEDNRANVRRPQPVTYGSQFEIG